MWRLLGILVAVMVALFNVSCGSPESQKSPAVPPANVKTIANIEDKKTDNTAYELLAIQVQTIIEKNCISCHRGSNPAAGLDFTVESVIVANARDIADFILEGGLPAQDSLTTEEIEIIRAWQEANYPRPKSKSKPDSGKDKNPDHKNPGQNDKPNKNDDYKKDGKPKKDQTPKKKRLKRLLRCAS